MSVHKSLKTTSRLARARSVLTRYERLVKLEQDGRWEEGQSVFGLPKVRIARPKARKKKKKDEEATEAAAPAKAAE